MYEIQSKDIKRADNVTLLNVAVCLLIWSRLSLSFISCNENYNCSQVRVCMHAYCMCVCVPDALMGNIISQEQKQISDVTFGYTCILSTEPAFLVEVKGDNEVKRDSCETSHYLKNTTFDLSYIYCVYTSVIFSVGTLYSFWWKFN